MLVDRHADNVAEIAEVLSNEYKDFAHYNKDNPLDELIFIVCSIKRSEKVYISSYRRLKTEYSTYQQLLDAPTEDIAAILSSAGLQNQKAVRLKDILASVTQRIGRPSLQPLKHLSDKECEDFLIGLPGVGKKIARCVMMYSFRRSVFPVDSNCWRISCRLGWVDKIKNRSTCSEKGMDYLQSIIPRTLRFSLHVNMVSHGRKVCKSSNPDCHRCVIKQYCLRRVII